VEAFLNLTKEMAQRHGIATHSQQYYLKMLESFPQDLLKIYVAEYDGKIISANLVLFFGKTATYLHGASGDSHRNVMAPFLLQWQAILDAKERGCASYDFGGVETRDVVHQKHSDLVGVTNFKLGFSPSTKAIVFPGSYDIIINSRKYWAYRGLQRAKSFAIRFRK
jgi:lipid II:glycine glycyltransferase (peptidoglycan interpeptide bridge formation enzyme)